MHDHPSESRNSSAPQSTLELSHRDENCQNLVGGGGWDTGNNRDRWTVLKGRWKVYGIMEKVFQYFV